MRRIGLTGPTGAGKTTVLQWFADQGAFVADADAIYHELLYSDKTLQIRLQNRFPNAFPEGQLDRKKLGTTVYSDPIALRDLERITHPAVIAEIDRRMALSGAEVAVIDAIALIESGIAATCDITLAVLAEREMRIRRVMARDGVTRIYAEQRIQAQKPDEYYTRRCNYTIYNNTEIDEPILQHIWEEINMEEKSKRREELFRNEKCGYDRFDAYGWDKVEEYSSAYKKFLDAGKTERCCVDYAVAMAEKHGFKAFERGVKYNPGDKVYYTHWNKSMMLFVIGKQSLRKGFRVMAAHIDAPRIDLKGYPLYEDGGMAYMKTHYYGGIKKYQWMTIPLEMRGVVCKKDGSTVKISIGSDPGDPVFVITDLLPHLAADQYKKNLSEAFTGEGLNILVGAKPDTEEGKDRVRLAVLEHLLKTYGITEEDFLSAELSMVPAVNARDVGFDRAFIGGYGHDDRSCSFGGLHAICETQNPEHTAVCVLADKEEIGSEGVTGMRSAFIDDIFGELCAMQDVSLRECYANSFCLSGDVTCAFDPNFAEVTDKRNTAKTGFGVSIMKYTGQRGKSGASDASAETVARARKLLDDSNVLWQMGELGKVDQGGGGTVAAYFAQRNIEVLDIGVPVLSMHAPYELIAKLDAYMMYKASFALFTEH